MRTAKKIGKRRDRTGGQSLCNLMRQGDFVESFRLWQGQELRQPYGLARALRREIRHMFRVYLSLALLFVI